MDSNSKRKIGSIAAGANGSHATCDLDVKRVKKEVPHPASYDWHRISSIQNKTAIINYLHYPSTAACVDGACSAIAGFDFDDTVVKHDTAHVKFLECAPIDTVYEVFRQLNFEKGYHIAIFSNQGTIGMCKKPDKIENARNTVRRRFQLFIETLFKGRDIIPITILFSEANNKMMSAGDIGRKPCIGMWFTLLSTCKKSIFDHQKSFFVGDATGEHNSHSDCDIQFAKNANIKFISTKEYWSEQT